MAKQIDFWTLLKLTQEYVSQHYAAVLPDKNKLGQLKAYVDKYLRENDYHVENLTTRASTFPTRICICPSRKPNPDCTIRDSSSRTAGQSNSKC